MENFEMAALPLETQRNIEADSFWCMSKLLDGIQVCSVFPFCCCEVLFFFFLALEGEYRGANML